MAEALSMINERVKNSVTGNTEGFLDSIKRRESDINQPCVCNACVTCTAAGPKCKPVHLEKNNRQVEICDLSELTRKDIKLAVPFEKCMKTADGKCDSTTTYIEGREWQMADESRSHGPGLEPLNHLTAYMVCMKGPGIIYFTSAGQGLKLFVNNYAFETGDMKLSENGKELVKGFELSIEIIEAWDLGEFDKNGNLIGIYPYYVFKKDSQGQYISDGGITIGYGHWISQSEYYMQLSEKNIIDQYAFGASFVPPYIPSDGRSYKVPNSKYIPLEEINKIFDDDISVAENAVNDFVSKISDNQVKLNQNQFDALVSFTHQYGVNWWTLTPEKVLPKFIREGKDFDNEVKVRSIFEMHDDKNRREIEAEIFLNGY